MRIIGHRGARGEAPENTLGSFRYLHDLGVRAVEFDVRQLKDDQLVVIHDDDFVRTTGKSQHVESCNLSEAQQFDHRHQWQVWGFEEYTPSLPHVMDCLTGYLLLGKKLLEQNIDYSGPWNFSPESNDSRTVGAILNYCKNNWDDLDFVISSSDDEVHESKILKLGHEKSARLLNWQTKWNTQQAVEMTIAWYKSYYINHVVKTNDQISKYFNG